MEVLKKIPHRHFVFSIPKILRRYFLYDRKLLAALSRCAWESLKVFLQHSVSENEPIPGAVIAMQTFGDFLGFNPHYHILVTDSCFYGDGRVFDSSIKRGQPAEFPLNGVIACWSEGVGLMKAGGKAKLVCPSNIAYGDIGRPPVIPGGANLVFEIELLEIRNNRDENARNFQLKILDLHPKYLPLLPY